MANDTVKTAEATAPKIRAKVKEKPPHSSLRTELCFMNPNCLNPATDLQKYPSISLLRQENTLQWWCINALPLTRSIHR